MSRLDTDPEIDVGAKAISMSWSAFSIDAFDHKQRNVMSQSASYCLEETTSGGKDKKSHALNMKEN